MNSNSQALDVPRKKAEQIGLNAPAPDPSGDDAAIDLAAVWHTIKRGKWVILTTCMLITAIAVGYTMTLPPVYEAQTIVAVEANPAATTGVLNLGGAPELATEIGILENSGELARRVVVRLRTMADTSATGTFPLFEPTEEEPVVNDYAASVRLMDQVSYQGLEEQALIRITAASTSPTEAHAIANTIAREYRLFSQEMARSGVVAARQFLEGQLDKRKDDIQQIENEWALFAQSNAVATEGEDGQRVAQEFVQLQTQRDGLQFQLEQEQRMLTVLQNQLGQIRPTLRDNVLQEQRAQSLRTQIQALENQTAALKTQAEQYYINNPNLRGNEDRVPELADLIRRIDGFEARKVELTEQLVAVTTEQGRTSTDGTAIGEVGTLQQRIQQQELTIGQIQAQIRALDQRIATYRGRISSIPGQRIQREQLERRLAQAEQFYKDIAMELQRTIIAEESELGYVQLVRAAVVPMVPVSPDMQQNVMLGLLLGLCLGVGFAFVRQSMNWQIYDPKDIQQNGYSLVGVIPRMDREIKKAFGGKKTIDVEGKTMSTSLLPLLNPWSPITENYRLVRTNLQFSGSGAGDPPEVMMVTSPEPSDGKTTTAVNLAITIALSGRKVLLIDADMRRPNCHKLLGVEKSPGLADMLTSDMKVEIVQRSFIEGLYFVPAGKPHLPPTEMLDSERMRRLIELGRQRCDVVIIDTPPVLAASDPVVLAQYCDATLVVASADKTDLRALEQTKKTLRAVGVPISGVIFNRYDVEKNGGDYKYGYGYDYKYDYTPAA